MSSAIVENISWNNKISKYKQSLHYMQIWSTNFCSYYDKNTIAEFYAWIMTFKTAAVIRKNINFNLLCARLFHCVLAQP